MRRWLVALLAVAVIATGVIFRAEVVDGTRATVDAIGSWSTRLRDVAAAEPETEVGLRAREGESAAVLLTLGSQEGDAAFALVVVDPVGPPMLILLPQDLLVSVPGFGEFRLVDALVFEGPELVALAITNQFGIRIDAVASLPAGAIGAGLLEPIVVELSVPLFQDDGSGVVRTLPAGVGPIVPGLVETLLVERGQGDVFEWIQRQGSAWRSILEAIAVEPRIADRLTADAGPGGPEAADLLVTVAADLDRGVATLPVSRAESSTGISALVPARGQIDQFLQERLGHLLLAPGGRVRIEILNGNGRIGTTETVASILIRAGYHLIKTDNADSFDYDETLVVAQGNDAEAAARDIVGLLGKGLLFLEVRAPSGVVDVSIIVGKDIPAGEG
jgi:hypothetical protein